MRAIPIISCLLLSLSVIQTIYAQATLSPFFLTVKATDEHKVFDQCVDMLIGSPYFIEFTDKDAGTIQCKYVVKNKNLFSKSKGNKLTYNLLLRKNNEQEVRIYLQANEEIKDSSGGSVRNSVDYYIDEGVTDEQQIYAPMLDALKQYLQDTE